MRPLANRSAVRWPWKSYWFFFKWKKKRKSKRSNSRKKQKKKLRDELKTDNGYRTSFLSIHLSPLIFSSSSFVILSPQSTWICQRTNADVLLPHPVRLCSTWFYSRRIIGVRWFIHHYSWHKLIEKETFCTLNFSSFQLGSLIMHRWVIKWTRHQNRNISKNTIDKNSLAAEHLDKHGSCNRRPMEHNWWWKKSKSLK